MQFILLDSIYELHLFCLILKLLLLLYYVYYAEYHLRQLKAKIVKLSTQLLEPQKVCYYLYCLLLVSTSRFSFSRIFQRKRKTYNGGFQTQNDAKVR